MEMTSCEERFRQWLVSRAAGRGRPEENDGKWEGMVMPAKTLGPENVILVEFEEKGLARVSLTPEDLAEKSARALDKAMQTIRGLAERLAATVQDLPTRPQAVEVAFGLKLNAEAGALIARTGGEASLNVKLTWKSS